MKQIDRCFEAMKKGLPWNKIKENFPGGSTRYGAFSKYFPWAEKKHRSLQQKFSYEEEKLASLIATEEETTSRKKKLIDEVNELTDQANLKRELLEELSEEERVLEDRIQTLTDQLEEFTERGVTKDTLDRISRIDFEDDDELLARIETLEEYQALFKVTSALRDENSSLLDEIKTKELQKVSLTNEASSLGNLIDEFKRRYFMWEEALKIVISFFQSGYNTKFLKSLKEALDALAIRGEPKRSMERLLNAMDLNRDLHELESKIRQETKRLTTIRAEINGAEGTLHAIRDSVLKEINGTYVEGHDQLLKTYKEIEKCLQEQSMDVRIMLENLQKTVVSQIYGVANVSKNEINALINSTRRLHNSFLVDIQNFVNQRGELERQRTLLGRAEILFGTQDPKKVKQLSTMTIITVLEKIHLWIQCYYPNVDTTPPPKVCTREWHLTYIDTVKVHSVSEWLLTDMKERYFGSK